MLCKPQCQYWLATLHTQESDKPLPAGVSLLTSGGTGFNKGDALCVLSAFIFGQHKFRTETVTHQFDNTQDLVAVQLAVLASCSFLATVPALAELLPNSSPGAALPHSNQPQRSLWALLSCACVRRISDACPLGAQDLRLR